MASMIIIYGIPNCDTVKKARTWLDNNNLPYTFHDYKKAGVDHGKLLAWCDSKGWEIILNRAGTTFKKLPDSDKSDLTQEKAIALMETAPSMIKRPVVEYSGGLLVGFKQPEWETAFS
jgi:arsenate reductase (glutaredoxin)